MGKIETLTLALCFLVLVSFEAIADSTTTIMSPDGSITVCSVGDNGVIICV
jgi:hypothetical protein